MELTTITDITRHFGITPRTLRYYEQIGLIESIRLEDYAYRVYDENNCCRIGQIVLLRKLRIATKQIAQLLKSDAALDAINVFEQRIGEISGEMDALATLRDILHQLVDRLSQYGPVKLSEKLLKEDSLIALIRTLPDETKLKEVRTMNELEQANQTLGKLTNVRILYLPPTTVAAAHVISPCPEDDAEKQLLAFARAVNITMIKPDVRIYGFNHPNPTDETGAHGYEFWMTIPDDLEVTAPLCKRHFDGGLYAAHMIKMGDFEQWDWLDRWVRENGEYVYRGDGNPETMFGALEEHLNAYTYLKGDMQTTTQLDLLIPVRLK